MKDEMTIIVIPPLVEGVLPPIVIAPPLVQLSNVTLCHKKKKTTNDETNVGGRQSYIALANILDLYQKE
jgi:hypothetical protein